MNKNWYMITGDDTYQEHIQTCSVNEGVQASISHDKDFTDAIVAIPPPEGNAIGLQK